MVRTVFKKVIDWVLRLLKGAIIGMDFVLPGISGAALAVVFGLYERIVAFIANVTKDFIKNILFFLPVGLGGLLGIYLISRPISFLLDNYRVPFYWFFVGAILGTIPNLWRRSGEKGRKPAHIVMLISTFVLAALFFLFSLNKTIGQIELTPVTAFGVGSVTAFTALIPGFSSSNFLVLIGVYEQMNTSYKTLNLGILIPFALGLLIFVFPFSKGIKFLLKKTFTGFFHVILGFVLASSVLVAAIASGWRQDGGYYNYLRIASLSCVVTLIAGVVFSYWMCRLGEKHNI